MKGGTTSSHHGSYGLGHTCATMVVTKRSKDVNLSKSIKVYLSSDCSLKFENIKAESLVIVDKNATVNQFSNLVHTARHAMKVSCPVSYI